MEPGHEASFKDLEQQGWIAKASGYAGWLGEITAEAADPLLDATHVTGERACSMCRQRAGLWCCPGSSLQAGWRIRHEFPGCTRRCAQGMTTCRLLSGSRLLPYR